MHAYLTRSYWSPGIPFATVERAARNSLCFGLYERADGDQVGLTRVVTDHATFAYLCDVYVLEAHRGRGLGKLLMATVMAHPALTGARRDDARHARCAWSVRAVRLPRAAGRRCTHADPASRHVSDAARPPDGNAPYTAAHEKVLAAQPLMLATAIFALTACGSAPTREKPLERGRAADGARAGARRRRQFRQAVRGRHVLRRRQTCGGIFVRRARGAARHQGDHARWRTPAAARRDRPHLRGVGRRLHRGLLRPARARDLREFRTALPQPRHREGPVAQGAGARELGAARAGRPSAAAISRSSTSTRSCSTAPRCTTS